MSRDLPRSSAVQAVIAAALVVGVLMLLIVSGSGRGTTGSASPEEGNVSRALGEGMSAIPPDEFFETITAAQREAGSWYVVSVSEVDGKSSAPSVQEVSLAGDEPSIRTSFDTGLGTIEAVYIGEDFYVKGFTGTETPWWKVTMDDAAGRLIASLAPYADPTEFLSSLTDLENFEVVGVEDVEVGSDGQKVKAVHYRMQIDASGDRPGQSSTGDSTTGGPDAGRTTIAMQMWVDAEDRPVRVETIAKSDGQTFRTQLYYTLYGSDIVIEIPPADETTTKTPKALQGALAEDR